ncbi:hypothetical protein COCON_G00152590 [Conger conger]|uniref:Queuosine 5'-phosphate N-glycosylase/hydrolase n=1 Tax=Conger conger TaxID=82655 RepID=A0A9Q1D8H2_CONCO|nr:hypothetical protein COCON_G00152590 [Conger conger]
MPVLWSQNVFWEALRCECGGRLGHSRDMEEPLSPRESGRWVAERSRDVFIEEEGVRRAAEMLYGLRASEVFTPQGWKKMNPLAPTFDSDLHINWVFVVDTMNFSFWPDREDQQCTVTHRGSTYSGYMALCAAVTRAMDEGEEHNQTALHETTLAVHLLPCSSTYSLYLLTDTPLTCSTIAVARQTHCTRKPSHFQEKSVRLGLSAESRALGPAGVSSAGNHGDPLAGVPITDAAYMASVSLEALGRVLRSDTATPMPMLEERCRALNEGGALLLRYGGSLRRFLAAGDARDAPSLIRRIVDNLPSYRDEAQHEGKKIAFYKRAQILLADFWGIMEARGEGSIPDLDYLTMFADYRVPQALVYLGVLRYSDSLMSTLKEGALLPSGDRREVEIRGCSIWCVERIKTELWKLVEQRDGQRSHINSALIDFYLWPYAKEHSKEMAHIPIHHTRCIYY